MVTTRVEVNDSPFTHGCPKGTLLRLPVAHGEGCFFADPQTLSELNANEQVVLRYADNRGQAVLEANPNGSIENIAGICNRGRNVFGLMPHPDRASDPQLGSADGTRIFLSMMETIRATRSSRRLTVGSSRKTSSPTSARAMASRMAAVGRVTVSERRSIMDATLARLGILGGRRREHQHGHALQIADRLPEHLLQRLQAPARLAVLAQFGE